MQDFENGEKPNNGDTELMIEDRHCFGSFPLDTRNNSSQLAAHSPNTVGLMFDFNYWMKLWRQVQIETESLHIGGTRGNFTLN